MRVARRSTTSARPSIGSPSSATNYLDFQRAALEIGEARLEAERIGQPRRAPPVPLEDCERSTIESALAAPRHTAGGLDLHETLPAKAAALTYALARSQACIDGNKRIALILLTVFARMNGHKLVATNAEAEEIIRRVAAADPSRRVHDQRMLTAWLDEHLEREGIDEP